ncbi:MAG TPA: diguanylate cyclase [Terracidiphilus sp.]|jgi:diguanylate cyclase (GGDEF)-like protein
MSSHESSVLLLASPDPALLAAVEPLLRAAGARVEVVLSAQAALACLVGANPPALFMLDAKLPDMPIGQLLAAARAIDSCPRIPIVLIADTVTQEWIDRLADGVIDDLILRPAEPAYWQLRIELLLRNQGMVLELETLREAAIRNAQFDRLTGIYNRETMLSMLFRETDRAQRINSSLCLVLFDIDDFGHWNSRLGVDACDELLCQVANRAGALLRSYDLLGRPGMDEFLIALPSCSTASAMILGERLRIDVFSVPFRVAGETIRLSACFGIANSRGRSPVVVLREAEKALEWAKAAGPESIQCFGCSQDPAPSPVRFLSESSGDELLAW